MKSLRAKRLLDEIDLAIKNINSFKNISSLEESYLAKFLVVFICGIYEEIIEIILNEKMTKCNIKEAATFIESSLHHYFRNPEISRIKGWLGNFNKKWTTSIEKLSLKSKNAFDSISINKNDIAHGKMNGITLSEIIQYYSDSKIVIETIDNIVL